MSKSDELNIIKKKYGEKFMHLCRELFPTILEKEGLLLSILENNFGNNSTTLYEDITKNELRISEFKDYIFNKISYKNEKEEENQETENDPYELLKIAGYNLYECKTNEEIQQFKKYYSEDEELCTFSDDRLKKCLVFFAVKKNADKILRKDFKIPQREDEYGTSVMSIQFTKRGNSTVSIKNRYNHKVINPDATYGNNLNKIIPGLEQAFKGLLKKRNMNFSNSNLENFSIPYYTKAEDKKYYKYNTELNGIYYCPGNIIIDNGRVIKLDSNQLLIDNFILDLKSKTIELYDKKFHDSFIDGFDNIEKIKITKSSDKKIGGRTITIKRNGQKTPIIIEIDKENNIVSYKNDEIKKIGNSFLYCNNKLLELSLSNLEKAGDFFMRYNTFLKNLYLPKLKNTGRFFLPNNKSVEQLDLPSLEEVGDLFFNSNEIITKINLPKLRKTGYYFLNNNMNLLEVFFPNLEETGDCFLNNNTEVREVFAPKLKKAGDYFMSRNLKLLSVYFPNIEYIGNNFLDSNEILKYIFIYNVKIIGDKFLNKNRKLTELDIPNASDMGKDCLQHNSELTKLNIFSLKNINGIFMPKNKKLKKIIVSDSTKVRIIRKITYYNPDCEVIHAYNNEDKTLISNRFNHYENTSERA